MLARTRQPRGRRTARAAARDCTAAAAHSPVPSASPASTHPPALATARRARRERLQRRRGLPAAAVVPLARSALAPRLPARRARSRVSTVPLVPPRVSTAPPVASPRPLVLTAPPVGLASTPAVPPHRVLPAPPEHSRVPARGTALSARPGPSAPAALAAATTAAPAPTRAGISVWRAPKARTAARAQPPVCRVRRGISKAAPAKRCVHRAALGCLPRHLVRRCAAAAPVGNSATSAPRHAAHVAAVDTACRRRPLALTAPRARSRQATAVTVVSVLMQPGCLLVWVCLRAR